MSRHARRDTEGEQDGQWVPDGYPAAGAQEDQEEPGQPPAASRRARSRPSWDPDDPLGLADRRDFPAADVPSVPPPGPGSSYPGGSYPGGGRSYPESSYPGSSASGSSYSWPDQAGPDASHWSPAQSAASDPGLEPMAPERWEHRDWAEQSWPDQAWPEQGHREPEHWEPDHRDRDYGDRDHWESGHWEPQPDFGSGELPPLPPPTMPGPGHPSGPLPPLPESDLAWRDPSGPQPVLPAADRDDPTAPGRRRSRHAGQQDDPGPEHDPGDYPAAPGRGRGRRRRPGPADDTGPGPAAYPDDSADLGRSPLAGHAAGDQQDYPGPGGWYGDVEEPRDWADEDSHDAAFLPGLDDRGGPGRETGGPALGRRAPARPATRKRRRGRIAILAALMVFVLILAAGGFVGLHYYTTYLHPADFSGPGSGTVVVQIKPGDPAEVVGQRLASLGVVASARAFSNAAKASKQGSALEPGFYRVHKHMQASLAFALLLQPSSRVQTKVTIPEGYRLSQIIQLLGKDTGNLKGYQAAIANPAALGLPAYANGKPEGYLFPATYDIQPDSSPVTVLKAMVARFNQEAASINLAAGTAHAQETEGAVITVASIVEAEGKLPQDYPKIAEVIYNRLNAVPPMNLQLDTTVLYAMAQAGSKANFSTTFPSPYNTYLHAGLPPGPIDSPGDAAIQAALHPAHGNFLYFLTINSSTGQTLFFTTATAFDAAVAKYGSTGSGNTGTGTGAG